MFPKIKVEAKNSYVEALGDILKIAPTEMTKVMNDYTEENAPDVQFNMSDMKFLNLTLKDSMILALRNNFDIRIARMDPIIKENDIRVAKSVFDPILTITGERDVEELPTVNTLTLGLTSGFEISEFKRNRNTLQATVAKLLETGGTFTLDFNTVPHVFIDPSPFNPLNPQSTASIEAKIKQPLLKNAGIFYNRSNIYIARNDKKRSILELKKTAIDVLNTAQKAYWELVKAVEELRVRKKSLERAKDLLKKNKIQVEVGTLAPIELLVAEEGLSSQLEGVVVAENSIKDREDDLKLVMNLSNNSLLSDVSIAPLDKASFHVHKVSFQESIKTALSNRPEVFQQGLDIANARIKVRQQKNQLLPNLDIETGISYHGMGSNFGNSLDSAFSEQFQREFFGVALEIPLGNREARSNYTKAKLEEKQTVFNTRKIEQVIVVEVRKAVRQIKTNVERIKASKKAKELSQERLDAEEKKYKVGRSTSLEVIRAQEDLAVAEGRATNALVDYQISLGNLDAVLGTILEKNSIIIEDEHYLESNQHRNNLNNN
ncbi:MAG: TolC family protein [Candidatus Scalindua sp.]|jgi:outer membrane protein TolC|nr:TolC family protein [Candidatus Scalindua sp.]MBT5307083.1 TolC family protein [Candidatus Scalindua sp.]MBT6225249.1 TolC family protein [Candidatus Scalindua sp.]MBT6563704.1 TolC family protein [Candidatus Scalindua sp.]